MLKDYLLDAILDLKRKWWYYLLLPVVVTLVLLVITDVIIDGEMIDIFSTKFYIILGVMYPVMILGNLVKSIDNWRRNEEVKFKIAFLYSMVKGLFMGVSIALLLTFLEYGTADFKIAPDYFLMMIGIMMLMESIFLAFDYNKREKNQKNLDNENE